MVHIRADEQSVSDRQYLPIILLNVLGGAPNCFSLVLGLSNTLPGRGRKKRLCAFGFGKLHDQDAKLISSPAAWLWLPR